jgi:hypothetical protein
VLRPYLRGVTLFTAITCILAGCRQDRKAEQIVADLHARILPAGATATNPAPVQRTRVMVSTTWEIHSSLSNDEMASWLSGTLKPDFTKTNATKDDLWFAKYDNGESERLEIHISQENGNSDAQVRLVIVPD